MSHEFETGFVVREHAWHQLAVVLDGAPTIKEGILKAGLDWDVALCPIETVHEKKKIEAKGFRATVRVSDGQFLGIVSDKYKVLQNTSAFKFFQPLLDDGSCALEAAGSLKGGKFVWVLAKIANGLAEVSDGDALESYLLLSNSHDGSRAITVAFTPIRVVCWNTLSWAHGFTDKAEAHKALRVLHVGDMKGNLKEVQGAIDVAARKIGDIVETAQVLRKRGMTGESFYQYLEQVYGQDRDKIRDQIDKIRAILKKEDLSEDARQVTKTEMMKLEEKLARPFRKDSTITKLIRLFNEGPGAEMAGQTLWGAMSAVTHYEEHERPGSNEARLASSWLGGSTAKIRDRALEVAVQMAS